ncbi:hypothetical protein LLEC1_06006, partial [Akanthomyces lecanii]
LRRKAVAPIHSEAVNGEFALPYIDNRYGALNAHQQESLDCFRNFVVKRGCLDCQTSAPVQDMRLLQVLSYSIQNETSKRQTRSPRTQRLGARPTKSIPCMRPLTLSPSRAASSCMCPDTRKSAPIDGMSLSVMLTVVQKYPQWTGRRDRFGAPLYVYAPQTLNI